MTSPEFQKIDFEQWEIYHNNCPMYNTKQLEHLETLVKTQTLPDIVHGDNRLLLVNRKRDLLYEFSPVDSLNLTNFETQKEKLLKPEEEKSEEVNIIDMLPENIQVQQAKEWKKRDLSQIEDFTDLKAISDWTYSTPYKGTLLKLSEEVDRIKETLNLDLSSDITPDEDTGFTLTRTPEDEIPVDRLTPANPIIHYLEVPFFEDELDDSGQVMSKVRFRIMKDCMYTLVRFYCRVDNVVVRILDTRIFHDFKENKFIREFWHKEATYDELRDKNFNLGSDWSINPQQADMVFNSLGLKLKVRDTIQF